MGVATRQAEVSSRTVMAVKRLPHLRSKVSMEQPWTDSHTMCIVMDSIPETAQEDCD